MTFSKGIWETDPYHHLAVAALGGDPDWRSEIVARLYREVDDEALLAFAARNGIASMVAHALMEVMAGNKLPSHWRQAHEASRARISAYLEELDRVAQRLAEAGIPLVALKNGGIARGIFPCPGCCPMGDLDVLVERRHFLQAHRLLEDEGYHFQFRSPMETAELEAAEKGGGTEYWKVLPGGEKLWLELQWRPVAGRWINPDREPGATELLARSLPIPGTAVRLLAPEDNLLQVALHTAKHSYIRAPGFRLHLDVERLARHYDLDWEPLVAMASSLRARTAVYFSLAIPKALWGTPIPEMVLKRLRPAAWKERLIGSWLAQIGFFDVQEPVFSPWGYTLFSVLLYDGAAGLLRSMFPSSAWMRQRYGFRSWFLLPYYHGRRLIDLVSRRCAA